MSYTIIKISKLPGIFPSDTFQDIKYTRSRVVRDGFHEQTFETENSYALPFDKWQRRRKIQTILYNKYKIQIHSKEHEAIEHLKYADMINIECEGVSYEAIVLEVSKAQAGDLIEGVYDVIFYDVNSVNYKNYVQPVNDYLKSSYIVDQYDPSQMIELNIDYGTGSFKFYTLLVPRNTISDIKTESANVSGIDYVSYESHQRLIDCVFYTSETNARSIKDNARFSAGYNGGSWTVKIGGTPYVAKEFISPSIERIEEAVDLYKVTFMLKYSAREYNIFE